MHIKLDSKPSNLKCQLSPRPVFISLDKDDMLSFLRRSWIYSKKHYTELKKKFKNQKKYEVILTFEIFWGTHSRDWDSFCKKTPGYFINVGNFLAAGNR
jgi:hypothetical protein